MSIWVALVGAHPTRWVCQAYNSDTYALYHKKLPEKQVCDRYGRSHTCFSGGRQACFEIWLGGGRLVLKTQTQRRGTLTAVPCSLIQGAI